MKKNLRFYIAIFAAKGAALALRVLKRNASYFPGAFALKLCPDFLARIDKPATIIGVTGTNGKTTVCNLIESVLKKNGYHFIDNRFGSNTVTGVTTTMIKGANIFGRSKIDTAVLELDERSAPRIFPYVQPDYLVCTCLFRDSIRRNAHAEFILDILNKYLPEKTKLILNADDLIGSSLGPDNEKVYFGVDRLESDLEESVNIINDMRICPKCNAKLHYNYVRYHHIGNAYCPECGFKSPVADHIARDVDFANGEMTLYSGESSHRYKLVSNSIFNLYNEVAAIALLKETGLSDEKISDAFNEIHVVESRYRKDVAGGINVITHLAKGQNPIACSCVFDYVKKEKGKKELILILFDMFDAKESSENMTWIYDCDFEFLNHEDIDRIIIGGPRAQDFYLRLLIAGVSEDKLVYTADAEKTPDYLSLDKNKDIYILYEMYDDAVADNVRRQVIKRIEENV